MTTSDFDMCLTIVLPGYNRSLHDMGIFCKIIHDESKRFPVPQGCKVFKKPKKLSFLFILRYLLFSHDWQINSI